MDDYSEGAHPKILKALQDNNFQQQLGYGNDDFCLKAANLIRQTIAAPGVDVHFVSGGTQANLLVISASLQPYEAVIAAKTAHIAVHETGAIEFTGHKIIELDTANGKLTPSVIKPTLIEHCDEHMVVPKMVYISNSTEMGTIYTKKDLEEFHRFCLENDLLLYMDGARLAASLVAREQDLAFEDIKDLVDVLYIGGTKNGALLGEAIVIFNEKLKTKFRYSMKQKGALLAKGRIFGIQFAELFRGNMYLDIASHTDKMAGKLAEGIRNSGYKFLAEPQTNILLPIFPRDIITKLKQKFLFHEWRNIDSDNVCIRLVTSWATEEKHIDNLIAII